MSGPLKFGLIGHNISYSKSADIFNAIFDITGINGSFEVFNLDPNNFEREFKAVIDKGINGLSVTIPYKSRVIPLLNDVAPITLSLDAVNSIAIKDGKLLGYNTDITAFARPLIQHIQQLKNKIALILGYGGGAKAAIFSLHTNFQLSQFINRGRNLKKIAEFQRSQKEIYPDPGGVFSNLGEFKFDDSVKFAIVVNCTPLGGPNHTDESPLPVGFKWHMTDIYYDLNYNSDNQTIREAAKNNVIAIDGSQMLVGQAIRSFEIWTGETVNFDEVYSRVFGQAKSYSA